MTESILPPLRRQFEMAAKLAHLHLDSLTTEECLWRPSGAGPHVSRGPDGGWVADWPSRETYDIGPPSIAWLTWHIGFWFSMLIDHSFGAGALRREDVRWPGDADAVRDWVGALEQNWASRLDGLSGADLQSTLMTRWPFQNRPFSDVVAWATLELTKNAAEIGYARFLYATRRS